MTDSTVVRSPDVDRGADRTPIPPVQVPQDGYSRTDTEKDLSAGRVPTETQCPVSGPEPWRGKEVLRSNEGVVVH